ncbi:MAG: methionine ABC transporter substrate-binding lipoprotein MetQ [Chthoniobacterales bacterium]
MKISLPFLIALAALLLTSCHKKQENNTLKVGVMAGRESELINLVARIAKEKYGINVEIVTFSDYAIPNTALNDGSIDLNAFQHKPYLDAQIRDRGYPLAVVGKTFIFPIAGYSQKIKNLSELQDHSKIAIPNDPSNMARALLLLQKQGLITLKEGAAGSATQADIISNPKNLSIIELDAAQLPRALQDVDVAVINTGYAAEINLLPMRDGLFVEEKDSPYVNLIVARENNKDSKLVKDFVKAYQSAEVLEKAQELLPGNVIQGW